MFTSTVLPQQTVWGNVRVKFGTYSMDGGTDTGTIDTELDQLFVVIFSLGSGAGGGLNYPAAISAPVNGSQNFGFVANSSGSWIAIGL
jgi:hypothetical protein